MKKKLCYILPQYDPFTIDHYYHIYELLEDVAKHLDVFLVIESATAKPSFKNIKNTITLKWRGIPFNMLERLFVFTYIRLKGYKRFYVHYSYSGAIGASLVTRVMGGKTFYWHSGLKKDFMVKWKFNWEIIKKKLFDDYAFLLTIRLIHRLVTGSEFMREYFWENFGVSRSKIRIMPNWVSLERFDPAKFDRDKVKQEFGLSPDTRVVLFIHWLSPRKGPQYLVEMAREVIRENPDVVFWIVGEGPYKDTLRQDIDKSGLQDVMKLIGGVPNQDIAKYYAAADLFIMPSEQEGFGRVMLEAIAMGIPLVVTDVGAVREILGERLATCVVTRGDIPGFAAKITEILGNDELRKAIVKAGLERVKHFGEEITVGRFVKVIEDVSQTPREVSDS